MPRVADAIAGGLLTLADLDRLHIRCDHGEPPDELKQLLRVIGQASSTFGDAGKAARWLRRPTRALGGQSPLDLLGSESGAQLVARLLGQIDHGIAPGPLLWQTR